MSFARPRLLLGLQPRLRVSSRVSSVHTALIAQRLLSTSTRSHAEHAKGSHHHNTVSMAKGGDINPYKYEATSIDKAVHLFFFTEILRGKGHIPPVSLALMSWKRNVDCAGKLLPTAIHHYVSI